MDARSLLLCLALALPGAAWASSTSASAGGGVGAALRLAIHIPKVVHMRVLQQPAHLEVTAADLERGFVIAKALVEVLSTHRQGYRLRALLASGPVVEAELQGLESPLRVDTGGAQVAMPSMVGRGRPAPYPVEYTLRLAPGTAPGTYAWPVALSVEDP